jgi:hypothetical protein
MKLMVMGYARHGKDTVAEILRDRWKLSFTSSSLFCAERVMMPAFKAAREAAVAIGEGFDLPQYASAYQCFEDRVNHRAFWYEEIKRYCEKEPSRLSREIFERHDVYAGIRSWKELAGAKNAGLYDHSIWVDRSEHVPDEPSTSCSVVPWMADFMLDNNGTLPDLQGRVDELMRNLYRIHKQEVPRHLR